MRCTKCKLRWLQNFYLDSLQNFLNLKKLQFLSLPSTCRTSEASKDWDSSQVFFVGDLSFFRILKPFVLLSYLCTITYKSNLTQKKCTKNPMLFLVSMGKTGLTHDFFFEFSLRPFEVVEVEWKSRLNFRGCDLQLLHSFLKVWLLTSKW